MRLPRSQECSLQGSRCTGSKAKKSGDVVKVIPLSRANNISIMLTQFAKFRSGSKGIRKAVFTGRGLGIERLSLLLQVLPLCRQLTSM